MLAYFARHVPMQNPARTSGSPHQAGSSPQETRLTTAIKMAWLAAGSKPVNHAMRAGRSFARENSGHPRARVAYLHEPSSIVSMAQTLLEILRLSNIRRQFFSGENCEAEAMEWLLQDD